MIITLFKMSVLKVKILWLDNRMKGKPVQCAVFECTDRAQFLVDYRMDNHPFGDGDDPIHTEPYQIHVCGTHRTTWPYRWATVVRTSLMED